MKRFYLPAGTVVHLAGIPFLLVNDTAMEGHPANFDLVLREAEEFPVLNFNPSIFRRIRMWWGRHYGDSRP